MRNYDRIHARKPQGIEGRKAYIVGGGIAGLSAAAFLVRDAYMPGENITVYDKLPVFGGSMDECGNAETGYISRGERELEPYMECRKGGVTPGNACLWISIHFSVFLRESHCSCLECRT